MRQRLPIDSLMCFSATLRLYLMFTVSITIAVRQHNVFGLRRLDRSSFFCLCSRRYDI